MTKLNATDAVSALLALANPSSLSFPRINADNTAAWRTPAQFRGDIGGTTVGQSIFTLANPSAISFLRINADNTTTSRSAANFRTDLGLGTGDSPTFAGLNSAGVFTASASGNVKLFYNPGDVSGSGSLALSRAQCIGFFSGAAFGGSTDAQLWSPAANTLYQRNGTNAQTFLLANTYTDASNYERAVFGYRASELIIGHEALGSGNANRTIKFQTNGFSPLILDTSNATFNVNIVGTGGCTWLVPTSATPGAANRTIAWELTSNTTLTIKVRGTDGTVRSGTVTLA